MWDAPAVLNAEVTSLERSERSPQRRALSKALVSLLLNAKESMADFMDSPRSLNNLVSCSGLSLQLNNLPFSPMLSPVVKAVSVSKMKDDLQRPFLLACRRIDDNMRDAA